MQAVMGLQVLILQLLLHFCLKKAHCTCHSSVLVIFYPMSLFKYFKRMDISALLPNPNGQRIMIVGVDYDDIAALLQLTHPNIHVEIVSPDQRVYNNDSSSEIQLHMPLHMTILRDRIIW